MSSESPRESERALPLSGCVVLDLTLARAGPTCVRLLADWGADVIKIEPPAGRDGPAAHDRRRARRRFPEPASQQARHLLDLKTAEARRCFVGWSRRADIVVENYRADVKTRLGIDYAS